MCSLAQRCEQSPGICCRASLVPWTARQWGQGPTAEGGAGWNLRRSHPTSSLRCPAPPHPFVGTGSLKFLKKKIGRVPNALLCRLPHALTPSWFPYPFVATRGHPHLLASPVPSLHPASLSPMDDITHRILLSLTPCCFLPMCPRSCQDLRYCTYHLVTCSIKLIFHLCVSPSESLDMYRAPPSYIPQLLCSHNSVSQMLGQIDLERCYFLSVWIPCHLPHNKAEAQRDESRLLRVI